MRVKYPIIYPIRPKIIDECPYKRQREKAAGPEKKVM